MGPKPQVPLSPESAGRIWRFEAFEFDEAGRELRSNGATIELESKPVEVLYQLLLHAGEVVTKEELLESVWPGVTVVEGSLATAVSKIRRALGEDGPRIVLTAPRVGYRLGVAAHCTHVAAPEPADFHFQPGEPLPGRDQWRFVRKLDASGSSEVWLAENPKTHESRVFKFAADGLRLKGLKREVTLARLLRESLGDQAEFVRVLEWNFDEPPFYLETEYCGQNLGAWAHERGGLPAIPLPERLAIMMHIVRGIAAAHDAGVLHKDLKPANILIRAGDDGQWDVKVADFGSGVLTEPARLKELGITNLGFTRTVNSGENGITGTLMYMPPEVLAGQLPTASADVYALGVMLYQIAAGDFRKPLAPGWEADVNDPVLRDDIAAAACGDPARRLSSAAALLDRLQNLDRRREERNELELAKERTRIAEERVAASRARRPWVIAAVAASVAGLGISTVLYFRAAGERDRANRQTVITAAINRFLAEDLLGRSDPFQSGKSQETLVNAVQQSSPDIDRQFRDTPAVAARLHQTIARALDNRSDYPAARAEYQRAAALFPPGSADAIALQLQRAAMEARTYQKDSLAAARSIVAAQEPLIAKLRPPREDLAVWLASARGMIGLIDNDAKTAATQFQAALDGASPLPEFDENARLTFKQRRAFASIRLGDGATAERLFRELIDAFTRADGADSPRVLRVRLNLAQAFMIEGRNREAIDETTRIYPEYVAQLGETHELTMQLLTTRAQCEGSIGDWNGAIRDDLAIHEIATRKQGPESFFAVATLSDAALAQCRAGRYREGETNARKAFDASVKAFGPKAGLTGGVAHSLASCEIELGKLDEASLLLENIDAKAVAQLAGFPDWWANVALSKAEIAYRKKDYAAARQLLDSAAPVFSKPDAEVFQKQTLQRLLTAVAHQPGR
jgi:serine/threonine protein kinase/DNA-binding winged helix-turn-helix (wHTH) protein